MPVEWILSIVITIVKGKCDIMKCNCYRDVKFLEHGVKVVEKGVEKDFAKVTINKMEVVLMPEKRNNGCIYPANVVRIEPC